MKWTPSQIKDRLDEALRRADEEAQTIVSQHRDYVLISGDAYRKLNANGATFTDFLIDAGPRFDELSPMERIEAPMRDPQL